MEPIANKTMFSQLAHVAHVLLFGRLTKIFKLDVFLEFSDRRIVDNIHRRELAFG